MFKNLHLWLPGYCLGGSPGRAEAPYTGLIHIFFTIADHFEPKWGGAAEELARRRVKAWLDHYPRVAARHLDFYGRAPQHNFFYPFEEYEAEYLDQLAGLCAGGFGEVEVHLHHDQDTEDGLRQKLETFKTLLSGHGLLSRDMDGKPVYGFIHGNWTLDNCGKNGRWCGVNRELAVLKTSGCYGDFTLPSAPSETQTRKINSIYYAKDGPEPKSHNTGTDARKGTRNHEDLLLVQGPLALNFQSRKWGMLPRIENGEITRHNPPHSARLDLWVRQRIQVLRKPDWLFIKTHTHGAQDNHTHEKFFKSLDDLYGDLLARYNDGNRYRMHFVSTRQMVNLVHAAEDGRDGDPENYLDYVYPKPPVMGERRV